MKKSYYRTDYLFPRMDFLIGAGSILDLFASFFTFNASTSEEAADSTAIESDFGVVGEDIRKSLNACN